MTSHQILYRRGWNLHRDGVPAYHAISRAEQAGWRARHNYMAGPLPAQVAALAETVADVGEWWQAEGARVTA